MTFVDPWSGFHIPSSKTEVVFAIPALAPIFKPWSVFIEITIKNLMRPEKFLILLGIHIDIHYFFFAKKWAKEFGCILDLGYVKLLQIFGEALTRVINQSDIVEIS
jgi:hypothetical protein